MFKSNEDDTVFRIRHDQMQHAQISPHLLSCQGQGGGQLGPHRTATAAMQRYYKVQDRDKIQGDTRGWDIHIGSHSLQARLLPMAETSRLISGQNQTHPHAGCLHTVDDAVSNRSNHGGFVRLVRTFDLGHLAVYLQESVNPLHFGSQQ